MKTDVTVITPEGENNTPFQEQPADVEVVAETVADASVEIAKIEADKEIKIAEIAAETVVAQTEAVAEVSAAYDAQAEIGQCRQSIETLQSQMTMLQETQASILSRLTPVEPLPQNPDPESVVVDPQGADAPPVSTESKPAKRKRFRLI